MKKIGILIALLLGLSFGAKFFKSEEAPTNAPEKASELPKPAADTSLAPPPKAAGNTASTQEELAAISVAKTKKDKELLLRYLEEGHPVIVQDSALEALTELGAIEHLKSIAALASSQDSLLLAQVMKSLATLAAASPHMADKSFALNELQAIYQRFSAGRAKDKEDAEADLNRSNAIEAMGQIQTLAAEDALLDILAASSTEPYIQYFVVSSLGRLRARSALPALEALAASLPQLENPQTEEELTQDALAKAIEKAKSAMR